MYFAQRHSVLNLLLNQIQTKQYHVVLMSGVARSGPGKKNYIQICVRRVCMCE